MRFLHNRKSIFILQIIIGLTTPGMVRAQTSYDAYSLSKLINAAERYMPSIQQQRALEGEAQANILDTKHRALPFLKFNAQTSLGSSNSVRGSYFPMGIAVSSSGSVTDQQLYQAALGDLATLYSEYDISTFGLNKARNQNAIVGASLSTANYNKSVYQLKGDLAKLYFSILSYTNLRDIDKQNVERYATIDTVIQSLTRSGLKPGSDFDQANAELANAKISLNQTNGFLEQALQLLSAYTGISADSLNISGRILNPSSFDNNLFEDSAKESNPLLDYFKSNNDYLQTGAVLIRKSYLPKITLIGSVWGRASSYTYDEKFEPLYTGLGFQRFNYAAGVAFIYDFMDGLHKRDKIAESDFELQAGQEAYNQEKLDLASATTQANLQLQVVVDNLKQLAVQKKSALAVFKDKQAQYKAGIVTLIDLTNAGFVLYRSQVDYLNAVDSWYSASLNKAIATGNLDNFIQSIN
jgi:outer membrane protein